MIQIKTLSRGLKWFFIFMLCYEPFSTISFWLINTSILQDSQLFHLRIGGLLFSTHDLAQLTLWQTLSGLLCLLIPTGLCMTMYFKLIQLFKCFEHQNYFTLESSHYLYQASLLLIVSELARFILRPLLSFIMTYYKPTYTLAFGLDGSAISNIVFAMIAFAIVWIFREGYRLQKDSELTI